MVRPPTTLTISPAGNGGSGGGGSGGRVSNGNYGAVKRYGDGGARF